MAEENRGLNKTEPRNLEAEAACLGALLMDRDSIFKVHQQLVSEDFYSERHRVIFQAVMDLNQANKDVDLGTLTWHLRDNRLLEKAGGSEYLNNLLEMVPTSANVDYYIGIIQEKSQRRGLITAARNIINNGFDESLELKNVVETAEKDIFHVTQRTTRGGFEAIGSVLQRTIRKIFERPDSGRLITGLSTGFKRMDETLDGLLEGQFIIVAARPSMGKTAFAVNIAEHIAHVEKQGVAIFSLEMPTDLIMVRMLSTQAHVDGNRLRKGAFSREEKDRIMLVSDKINGMPIHIDDTSGISIFDIRSKLRSLLTKNRVGLVVIDYLQMMQHPEYRENRQQQIAEISRGLKSLAKELNVCIMALSQLNRKAETREDKMPQLSDLRESGAIEQDADVVILIHREEHYKREHTDEKKKGKADIIIAKNRNGPVGQFELAFRPEFTEFQDLDYIHEGGADD